MNGISGKWTDRDGLKGELAREEVNQKWPRVQKAFDELSLKLYYGFDFRQNLFQDPEALDLAEKLLAKLNKK